MKYYMAPLEGITTYIFRQVYHKHFSACDKYFTPFLASSKLSWKEKNEVEPENNEGMVLVPQILANNPETFLSIATQLKDMGYESVNLNLGCPSGTVVSRKRGAGQLSDTYALEKFLDSIFEKCDLNISIKTRVGMSDICEWEDILEVYSKFPLEELIIHPRLREDFYTGKPRLEAFRLALDKGLEYPICYNGDIVSKDSIMDLSEVFPEINCVMIGRGLLKKPWLVNELKGTNDADVLAIESNRLKQMEEFISELADSYEYHYGIGQDRNVLFKIKDVWNYLGQNFEGFEKELKAIRKSDTLSEYRIEVKKFFRELGL